MNDIERAIDVQQKLIKKWENRAKKLEEVIEKYPWEKMGYESADWRESELKRRKEQILTALITISALKKQMARSPVNRCATFLIAECPRCNGTVSFHHKHCHWCGQKLDWENEGEEE